MDGIRRRPRHPRLLLINPRFRESFWSFRWALREILSGKRAVNPPLGLATLAALCPPEWQVRIVDETIESVPLHPDADIVGVCGMGAQHRRQAELLRHFRGQGYYTVAGGSYASLCPERYAGLADTVVSGEAEYIWKAFCRDFTAGQPRPLYRETGTVALADSPVPRFDLLKLGSYTTATLQFSRGCPYRCEFCDIIGIESPDEQTLRETRKTQNTHEDVLTSVRRIFAHGIDVLGGFIIGFDNDTPATFEQQHRFISTAGIQVAMIGLLTALPRTPLHERLRKEGRLLGEVDASDNTQLATNVVPKRMGYDEMIAGYQRLYRRLLSDRGIARRVRNKARHMGAPVYRGEYTAGERMRILARLFLKGLLPGGPPRVARFLRSLPWFAPAKIPLAVMDWIAGLSMRDYIERHFTPPRSRDIAVAGRWFASIQRAIRHYVKSGGASVELKLLAERAPRLRLRLTGALDRAFFARCARRLERLLSQSRASVTLVLENIEASQLGSLQRMLRQLARHGDRVFIELAEPLHKIVRIDSSVFNLVLTQRAR
jgi:hypothetical protein